MRGQAYTLEAIIGAMLVLTSLVFALQVTAVTPLSSSTASQHLENQQQATAEGALAAAEEQGALKPAVVYGHDEGNNGRFSFHETDGDVFYSNGAPTNRFGAILDRQIGARGLAFNVYVVYQTTGGSTNKRRMVYQGNPSDNAVTARRTVTLYDDDVLHEPDDGNPDTFDVAQPTPTTLDTAGDDFFAQDTATGSQLFNVVEVEVVVWRQ